MTKRVFTLQEQIGCIDRHISFQERVISVFENEDPNEVAKAREELEILKNVRETLQFDNLIEQTALAEERPWHEESIC